MCRRMQFGILVSMGVKTSKSCFGFFPRNRGFLKVSVLAGVVAGLLVLFAIFIFADQYRGMAPGRGLASNDPGVMARTANILSGAFRGALGNSDESKPIAIVSRKMEETTHDLARSVPSSGSAISVPAASGLKKKSSSKKRPTAATLNDENVKSAENKIETETASSSGVLDSNKKPKKTPVKNSKSKETATAPCGFYSASSASHQLVINEIAWMGSPPRAYESSTVATGNEWIELKNVSGGEVDISGWRLMNQNGKIEIVFDAGHKLAPEGIVLLERTDDETIPWVKADKIYTGSLSNAGDWLALYDAGCEKVDEVNALAGWVAGDKATKQTMERGRDFLWHTSVNPGGTPHQENTGGVQGSSGGGGGGVVLASYGSGGTSAGSLLHQDSGGQAGQGGTSASPGISSSSQPASMRVVLFITEVQTASASSSRDEWVEIYNPTSTDMLLTGWYLQKHTKNASSSFTAFAPKELFANMTIKGLGYLIIAHPSSTVVFDIATDNGIAADNALALKNPDGEIVDLVGWGEASTCEGTCAPNASSGVSLSRKYDEETYIDTDDNASDFFFSLFPTPGARNASSSGTASSTPTQDSLLQQASGGQAGQTASSTATSTSTSDNSSSTPPVIGNSTSTATSTLPVASSTTPTSTTIITSSTPALTHIVIFEIQTTGGPGNTTNDYIRLLNPTSSTIDISNWKLRKRTSSGSESSVRVFSSGSTIIPGGYFVWANSADGFADTFGANVSSTASIADDTSIALEDSSGAVIDAVAWGSGQTSPFVEGSAFPQNPGAGQKLARKTDLTSGFIIDTDNNSTDFELR
jgi:Lamin Tail Domain